MRITFAERLEAGRTASGAYGTKRGDAFGLFDLGGPCRENLRIVASGGPLAQEPASAGWEHVSVSTRRRCPNWEEMCFAKELFWEDEEAVLQFHPPKSQWVDNHPYCLHLWRPPYSIVLPPSNMVGVRGMSYAEAQQLARSR